MTDRPILFNAPMVRAILNRTKKQTRRILKPQPSGANRIPVIGHRNVVVNIRDPRAAEFGSPYQPGDRLWVRETFTEFVGHHAATGRWAYRANIKDGDSHSEMIRQDYIKAGYPYQWKPSIHMPRAASRITLEITGVRVERLNEISRGDAMSEGCPFPNMADGADPRKWFEDLWESIYGTWAANPWVWVVEFRRI